jgi:hypothetical protein
MSREENIQVSGIKQKFTRFATVVLAWALIAAAFYEKPELLTGLQRVVQRSMEAVGDSIPSPWGPRIEFVFREIGGFIWLQNHAYSCFSARHNIHCCDHLALVPGL